MLGGGQGPGKIAAMGGRRVPGDVVAAAGPFAVGGVTTALVHVPRTRAVVQRLDDRWYMLI